MRAIEHKTISGEDDGRLVLGNAQVGAQLIPLGSGWTRIRIGLRLCLGDSGANIISTPRFYIGVMNNPSASMENGPLTTTTGNFVGLYPNAASWTRVSGSGIPGDGYIMYNWCSTTGWHLIHKSGNSIQTGTTNIGSTGKFVSARTGSVRTALVVDILKGGQGFTGSIILASNTTGHPDVTYDDFYTAMENPLLSDVASAISGSYSTSTGTIVCDESSGSLDSICVAWDRSTNPAYISDILWTHFDS